MKKVSRYAAALILAIAAFGTTAYAQKSPATKAKYGDIPVFVVGDMNCEEKTIPIQQFIQEGFIPCYKAATTYGDNNNGHHICGPKDGYSVKSRRKGPDRETGAIDHCFILDPAGNTEVKVFDCIMDDYLVKLTDHYPLLIDAKL